MNSIIGIVSIKNE